MMPCRRTVGEYGLKPITGSDQKECTQLDANGKDHLMYSSNDGLILLDILLYCYIFQVGLWEVGDAENGKQHGCHCQLMSKSWGSRAQDAGVALRTWLRCNQLAPLVLHTRSNYSGQLSLNVCC